MLAVGSAQAAAVARPAPETIGDVIACVDTSADAIVDELLCLQFPANGGSDWPCPPEAGP